MIPFLFRVQWSLVRALINQFFPPKPKNISGKVVLITGGAQGIGQHLAYKFAKHGVQLALVDLNEIGMMETKENVERNGTTCRTYKCDIAIREEVAKLGEAVRQDFERVDILVNNAGIVPSKHFLEVKDSEIRRTIEVNLFGTIWMTKEFVSDMTDRNEGHIINISSIAGFTSFPCSSHYCASKFGVNGFGQALAADLEFLKMTGIHLTTVYPGPTDTPMTQSSMKMDSVKLNCLTKPEVLAEKVVNGVLINKRYIYVPEILWRLCALRNLLPEESRQAVDDYQKKIVEINT